MVSLNQKNEKIFSYSFCIDSVGGFLLDFV